MIDDILKFIKAYLNKYLEAHGLDNYEIELGRLGKDVQDNKQCSLLITLLHIEEERSLKMQSPYVIGGDGKYKGETKSPEILLNMYVAISSKDENYETALKLISYVISAFQEQGYFDNEVLKQYGFGMLSKVSAEMHPMSLNEANNLWESLSEQRIPFIVYKLNSWIVASDNKESVRPIEKIEIEIK